MDSTKTYRTTSNSVETNKNAKELKIKFVTKYPNKYILLITSLMIRHNQLTGCSSLSKLTPGYVLLSRTSSLEKHLSSGLSLSPSPTKYHLILSNRSSLFNSSNKSSLFNSSNKSSLFNSSNRSSLFNSSNNRCSLSNNSKQKVGRWIK